MNNQSVSVATPVEPFSFVKLGSQTQREPYRAELAALLALVAYLRVGAAEFLKQYDEFAKQFLDSQKVQELFLYEGVGRKEILEFSVTYSQFLATVTEEIAVDIQRVLLIQVAEGAQFSDVDEDADELEDDHANALVEFVEMISIKYSPLLNGCPVLFQRMTNALAVLENPLEEVLTPKVGDVEEDWAESQF